ncbi:unnamed protein product [Nezara viridula]|uniref:Uncharacterized protein n=1 Tax=Nezara viridula TaxID=85310 RepID=A0A9P0HM77_NEZVI|nr:unnamed protein product [Nezara viridula]
MLSILESKEIDDSISMNATAEDLLHTVPNTGAGEGVPLQQVPDEAAEDRDRPRALPDGEADQDLVPEPEDEVEEGAQDGLDERHPLPLPHVPALRESLPVHAPDHLTSFRHAQQPRPLAGEV